MSNLATRVSELLLPRVRQPGQYIGGEVNSLRRDWASAEVRIALAFPDTYAIGMSHLGSAILYSIANQAPGVACERVFSPWLDAERVMRQQGIELFTWESRQPVASADMLAISLQYEMNFTNVLTLLDLAGLPLRSAERLEPEGAGSLGGGETNAETRRRGDAETGVSPRPLHGESAIPVPVSPRPCFPLVIAGGPQSDNPEPLADFIDLFVMGDGEHAMAALIEDVREFKRAGASRPDMLAEIACRHDWAYAPSLYGVSYASDGTVSAVVARGQAGEGVRGRGGEEEDAETRRHGDAETGVSPRPRVPASPRPPWIRRCRTPDFETAAVPLAPIIPWTRTVHERINVEIMRGCPQRCRFCHAGHTRRPLVWRSVDRIVEIAERSYRATGFDEIALTSLSTSDYPHLDELIGRLNATFAPLHVSISVPSLRVDKQLACLPWQLQQVRKSGLTIAVEAAREPMRRRIGKKVADADLMEGVRAAYRAGWRSVKLYFMVGFPGETEDDIRGIIELAVQVARERKAMMGQPASVTVSVAPLVPKPHTPFQWIAQPDEAYFGRARDLLKSLAVGTPVHVSFHRIDRSLLEAVMSRGDRRLGRAIELAWRAGARFDGWDECFNYSLWQRALADAGLDPAFYAHRVRPFDEILPWDHIESGGPRDQLERSAREATG